MSRKTFDLNALGTKINARLAEGTDGPETRLALAGLLEGFLMDGGCYRGFRYLSQAEVPSGQAPGIENGVILDDTRRSYPLPEAAERKGRKASVEATSVAAHVVKAPDAPQTALAVVA